MSGLFGHRKLAIGVITPLFLVTVLVSVWAAIPHKQSADSKSNIPSTGGASIDINNSTMPGMVGFTQKPDGRSLTIDNTSSNLTAACIADSTKCPKPSSSAPSKPTLASKSMSAYTSYCTQYPSKCQPTSYDPYNLKYYSSPVSIIPSWYIPPLPDYTSVPSSTYSFTPQYTYTEAYQLAEHNCYVQMAARGVADSSYTSTCIQAYLRSYGY